MPQQIRRLRKVRRVNLGEANSAAAKQEGVYASMVRYVQRHIKYPVILGALREGIPIPEIARWFAESEWIDVNERTFTEYLRVFKKRNPELIVGGRDGTIDEIIDAHSPNADLLTELNRLLRLQKLRIAIDLKSEQNIGKLFNTTVKEIEETRNLLELIGKVQGLVGPGSARSDSAAEGVSGEVRDSLRRIHADESQRDRMTLLTEALADSINAAVPKDTIPAR